ncbi:helix-turn-helix domain-containing protein [Streptomyces niveiscabiei]|uniref:helix-turn-helix domain-containing protein n=1 Tax=Streptomyces niveiscabiei TaxID=164115 RepID=UPI0029B8CBBE|nr:helix-turn-helix domain-containing protein [Streptomyces niveiscabiei]MDX3384802.1 helix-turn-helix domain-containing protein [Streptomyces niveiscabiei]
MLAASVFELRGMGWVMEPPNSDSHILAVLELLAEDSPPSRFDSLLVRARREGLPDAELGRLSRAVQLARALPERPGRRRQWEDDLTALVDTARDLMDAPDVDALLRTVARRARRLLSLDIAFVVLTGLDGEIRGHAAEGAVTDLSTNVDLVSEGSVGARVLRTKSPAWTADCLLDHTFVTSKGLDDATQAEGLRALLAVPLRVGDSAVGVLYGAQRAVRHFTPDEIGAMIQFADLAALAVDNARLLQHARHQSTELEQDNYRVRAGLVRLQELTDAYGRIMSLPLVGANLATIVSAAGAALDGRAQLFDPAGRPLACSEGDGEGGSADGFGGSRAGGFSRGGAGTARPGGSERGGAGDGRPGGGVRGAVAEAILDAHARRTTVRTPDGVWVAPVIAGAENLGYLVLDPETPLVGADERLLQLAAQVCAVQLLIQGSAGVTESPQRDELLDELVSAPPRAPRRIAQRARQLGVDLDEPYVVVVMRPEGGDHGRATVWSLSYVHRMTGLKTEHDGCMVLLLPGTDASGAARAVAGELSPLLGRPVSCGAAGAGRGVLEVRRVFQEAVRCLDAVTALDAPGATAAPQDLGFLGVLLSDDRDVRGFVDSTIGPILRHDEEHFTEFAVTLEAYFAAKSSPTGAAGALHVHPNTVSRRLERITALLGPDWQNPGPLLEIQLALRLHRVRDVLRR